MKHIILFLLLSFPLQILAQNGLRAFYPFNGNANDESGNGNDLVQAGGVLPTSDRFGIDSAAFHFDGVDGHLFLPPVDSLQFGMEDLTVCAWVKTTSYKRLLSRGECSGTPGWQLTLDAPGRIYVALSGGHYVTSSDTGFNDDQWHFLAFTRNAGMVQVYADGSQNGDPSFFPDSLFNATIQLAVGRNMQPSPCDQFFTGSIDDIRIFSRALSPSEIDSLYNLSPSDLIAYYPFNGNTLDESGNGHHALSHGAIPTADRFGSPSSAYHFDGSAYMDVASFLDLPQDSTARTVSAWVKSAPLSDNRVIVDWGSPLLRQRFCTMVYTVGNKAFFSSYVDDIEGEYVAGDNTWHHVVCTFDGSNVSLYVDGVPDSTKTIPLNTQGFYLSIGRRGIGDSIHEYMRGDIDDILIYNRALTNLEIDSLYHLGGWPTLVAHYPFNGNANDESGNGYHGTVAGATLTTDRFGIAGRAYSFSTVNSKITTTCPGVLGTGPRTLSMWVFRPQSATNHTIEIGYGLSNSPGSNWSSNVFHSTTTEVRVDINTSNKSYEALLDNNQWHHYVWIVPDTPSVKLRDIKVYQDGLLLSNLILNQNEELAINTLLGDSLAIGRYVNCTGSVDDVRLYNRAISDTEIQELFHEGGWPLQQTSWQSTLTAFDECDTLEIIIGQAALATGCIDSLYAEAELPPVGPSGTFDARLIPPCIDVEGLLRDFRTDSLTEVRWFLKLQACSPPITIRWDTTGFPSGCMHLKDPYGGNIVNVHMRDQTELVVPTGLTELWIERSEDLCRTIVTHSGWNMISLPIRVSPNYYLDLLPDAVSHPFRYTPGGYVVDDSLDPGVGYWIKFNGMHTYNICGCSVVDTCVDVAARWNMIGPFEDTVAVSTITSDPGGIIVSPFYHYFPPYQVVETLYPGQAYWVKVSQAGKLCFSDLSSYPAGRSAEGFSDELPPPPPDGELSNPKSQIPHQFSLGQNYPNPFNPSTTISYALPHESQVVIRVFDLLGREVATLVNDKQSAGYKSVEWNATIVSSGIYFYTIRAGDFVQTRKMLLLR